MNGQRGETEVRERMRINRNSIQTALLKSNLDIWITEASNAMIDDLIAKYHYSKKVTQNRWKSFAIYYKNELSGGMQIGYGIRPEMKEHIIKGATSETVKEFDRMWLSDNMPKNSESKCIGYLLRYLKKNYPVLKVLISYADGLRNKIGTIYQATNFVYIGAIKGEFYYIPSKDDWVHPVSMYHRHGTRAINTLKNIYPDIQHVFGLQHRYVYFLDPEWQNRLNIPIKPYPKSESSSMLEQSQIHEKDGGSNPTLSHSEQVKRGGERGRI